MVETKEPKTAPTGEIKEEKVPTGPATETIDLVDLDVASAGSKAEVNQQPAEPKTENEALASPDPAAKPNPSFEATNLTLPVKNDTNSMTEGKTTLAKADKPTESPRVLDGPQSESKTLPLGAGVPELNGDKVPMVEVSGSAAALKSASKATPATKSKTSNASPLITSSNKSTSSTPMKSAISLDPASSPNPSALFVATASEEGPSGNED